MGFNFSLFGDNSHRKFNYKPRFYDEEAEQRRQFFGDHGLPEQQSSAAGESEKEAHKPGRYIMGSFRDGNYQKTSSDTTKVQKIIGIVSLILIFVAFVYIAKFYGLIIK